MKKLQSHLPSALLAGYAVYSAFITINIAHSLILFSLAILFGFQSYLSLQETTKFNEESLEQLKRELENQLNGTKEFYEKKFSKLEDEVAKMAISSMPQKIASSSSPSPRKMVF